MARLNTIEPAQATGKAKELFDGPLKGKHLNIFKGMANSPAALQFYVAGAGALGEASLSEAEREVVQLVFAEANGCGYCAAAHTMIGKGAGLSEDQTIAARRAGDLGDAKLTALARFAGAMHEKNGNVSDADVAAFREAGYGDAEIAETVAAAAFATYTNWFNHVNQTAVDLPSPPSV